MDKADVYLSLNCVDKGLLALSSINECPHFNWIVRVAGEIDMDLLNRAILSVLQAHPNLRAKARTRFLTPLRRIQELEQRNPITYLDLFSIGRAKGLKAEEIDRQFEEELAAWLNKPLDPFKHLPVHGIVIRKSNGESYVVFRFDHSAIDGIRAVRFIEEVVRVCSGSACTVSSLLMDFRRSKGDELLEFARSQRAVVSSFYRKMLSSLFHRFFIAPFNPTARVFHERSENSQKIAHCLGSLSKSETEQMRLRAKAAGFTMNDLLLAACFRAIDRWNCYHRKVTKKITIMVPVDIGLEPFRGVLSNQVSYLSLPTLPRDRVDPLFLLGKIRVNMASMIENGIAFSMVYFLHTALYLPFPFFRILAKLIMSTRIYVDTILLTNLGVIWPMASGESTIGNSRVEDLTPIAPVVSPMGQSLCVYTSNGSLNVSLTYKTVSFSKEKAKEFLDLYLNEMRNYLVVLNIPSKPSRL